MSLSMTAIPWCSEPNDGEGGGQMRAMHIETVMGEFEDALDVLDQLHMVMARLKRMALTLSSTISRKHGFLDVNSRIP